MRMLAVVLSGLLILIQYPLWLGKGGWLRVWELDRQLVQQRTINGRLSARNEALAAEVVDLREGSRAVEERARYDLGMVKPGEIFIQINESTIRTPTMRTPALGSDVRTAATRFD